MIFSKACEYAIRATIYVALQSMKNRRTNLKDISSEIRSPEAYTAKILQDLARNNIIRSVKGSMGGFEIDTKRMNRIMLQDIVAAIDGPFNEKICVLGLKACSQKNPCPVHNKYKHIKHDFKAMIQNTSLYEMTTGIREGHTCLSL